MTQVCEGYVPKAKRQLPKCGTVDLRGVRVTHAELAARQRPPPSRSSGADGASRRAARPDRIPHWPRPAALTSSRVTAPPAMRIREAPRVPCTTGIVSCASRSDELKLRNVRSNSEFVSTHAPELLDRTEARPTTPESGSAGWLSSVARSASWTSHTPSSPVPDPRRRQSIPPCCSPRPAAPLAEIGRADLQPSRCPACNANPGCSSRAVHHGRHTVRLVLLRAKNAETSDRIVILSARPHQSCSIALKHAQRSWRAAGPAGCPQPRDRLG